MAEKCGKCKCEIATSSLFATCMDCKSSFHQACISIKSSQSLTKAKLKSWKCDSCKDETVSTASTRSAEEGEDRRSILDALGSMKAELSSQIGDVQGSISALTKDLKELSTRTLAVETAQSELNTRFDKADRVAALVAEDVRGLKTRLREVEQRSRAANVEIQGLPCTTGEDVYFALSLIAKTIGVEYNRSEISIAHRLYRFNKKLNYPPLIVQFVSRSVKELWCKAARSRRNLNSIDIEPSLQPSAVYINDHLTSDNKALLGRARRLLREKKLCFATYTNGKILVKRREEDEITRVTDMEDLDKFEN